MATANGAVEFEAIGAKRSLRFGINALCRIEDRLGYSVLQLGQKMQGGLDMRTLRTVFACGLDTSLTDDDAGEIMDAIGVQRAGELVGEAFQAAFPSGGGDEKPGRPRKAATATGLAG